MGTRILLNFGGQPIRTVRFKATFCSRIRNLSSSVDANSEDSLKKSTEFFNTIAQNYNKLNDVSTLRLHRSWRKAVVDSVLINCNSKILDAAGGTGANTLRLLDKAKRQNLQSDFAIEVIDLNPVMLKVGEDNYKNSGHNQNLVKFAKGDVQSLPFCDGSFDTVIFIFSIRRAIDFQTAFREIHRVLKPNGKVVVMDFQYSQNPSLMQRLYCNFYLRYIASIIENYLYGKHLQSSEYLVTEIREVIGKVDVLALMKEVNFKNIEFKPLSLGIAALTIGYKAQN